MSAEPQKNNPIDGIRSINPSADREMEEAIAKQAKEQQEKRVGSDRGAEKNQKPGAEKAIEVIVEVDKEVEAAEEKADKIVQQAEQAVQTTEQAAAAITQTEGATPADAAKAAQTVESAKKAEQMLLKNINDAKQRLAQAKADFEKRSKARFSSFSGTEAGIEKTLAKLELEDAEEAFKQAQVDIEQNESVKKLIALREGYEKKRVANEKAARGFLGLYKTEDGWKAEVKRQELEDSELAEYEKQRAEIIADNIELAFSEQLAALNARAEAIQESDPLYPVLQFLQSEKAGGLVTNKTLLRTALVAGGSAAAVVTGAGALALGALAARRGMTAFVTGAGAYGMMAGFESRSLQSSVKENAKKKQEDAESMNASKGIREKVREMMRHPNEKEIRALSDDDLKKYFAQAGELCVIRGIRPTTDPFVMQLQGEIQKRLREKVEVTQDLQNSLFNYLRESNERANEAAETIAQGDGKRKMAAVAAGVIVGGGVLHSLGSFVYESIIPSAAAGEMDDFADTKKEREVQSRAPQQAEAKSSTTTTETKSGGETSQEPEKKTQPRTEKGTEKRTERATTQERKPKSAQIAETQTEREVEKAIDRLSEDQQKYLEYNTKSAKELGITMDQKTAVYLSEKNLIVTKDGISIALSEDVVYAFSEDKKVARIYLDTEGKLHVVSEALSPKVAVASETAPAVTPAVESPPETAPAVASEAEPRELKIEPTQASQEPAPQQPVAEIPKVQVSVPEKPAIQEPEKEPTPKVENVATTQEPEMPKDATESTDAKVDVVEESEEKIVKKKDITVGKSIETAAMLASEKVKIPESVTQWRPEIAKVSEKYDVPAELIEAIIFAESSGNPNAKGLGEDGKVYGRGLAQFIESTGKQYGLLTESDRHDPEKSIDACARYLSDLLKKYNGRMDYAIAEYNLGGKAVNQATGEIKNKPYVFKVLKYYYAAGGDNDAQFGFNSSEKQNFSIANDEPVYLFTPDDGAAYDEIPKKSAVEAAATALIPEYKNMRWQDQLTAAFDLSSTEEQKIAALRAYQDKIGSVIKYDPVTNQILNPTDTRPSKQVRMYVSSNRIEFEIDGKDVALKDLPPLRVTVDSAKSVAAAQVASAEGKIPGAIADEIEERVNPEKSAQEKSNGNLSADEKAAVQKEMGVIRKESYELDDEKTDIEPEWGTDYGRFVDDVQDAVAEGLVKAEKIIIAANLTDNPIEEKRLRDEYKDIMKQLQTIISAAQDGPEKINDVERKALDDAGIDLPGADAPSDVARDKIQEIEAAEQARSDRRARILDKIFAPIRNADDVLAAAMGSEDHINGAREAMADNYFERADALKQLYEKTGDERYQAKAKLLEAKALHIEEQIQDSLKEKGDQIEATIEEKSFYERNGESRYMAPIEAVQQLTEDQKEKAIENLYSDGYKDYIEDSVRLRRPGSEWENPFIADRTMTPTEHLIANAELEAYRVFVAEQRLVDVKELIKNETDPIQIATLEAQQAAIERYIENRIEWINLRYGSGIFESSDHSGAISAEEAKRRALFNYGIGDQADDADDYSFDSLRGLEVEKARNKLRIAPED